MTNIEILDALREHYRFRTKREMAEFFNVSEQNLNDWYNRSKLDIHKIWAATKGEISPDWLLSGGEGDMVRPQPVPEQEKRADDSFDTQKLSSQIFSEAARDMQNAQLLALNAQQVALNAQKHIDSLMELLQQTILTK